VEFLLLLGPLALGKLAVTGEEIDSGSSAFSFAFTLTALSEPSSKLLNAATAQKVEAMVGFLARALKHYCETGQMLGKEQAPGGHGFRRRPRSAGILRRLGLA
jgi:predicted anti-sigma-YlaC factor YlaD